MNKLLIATLTAGLFAMPFAASADEVEQIDFIIEDGKVVPTEDFAVMVSVLGAAITSGGEDMPVTTEIRLGEEITLHPWGDLDSPEQGDVNTHAPTRHHVVREQFSADENMEISVTGRSWWGDGDIHLEANSRDQSAQVKVLRDGDPAPDIAGFEGQADAESFVAPYIDKETGLMTMDKNQAIYLFEIGTTNIDSSAADFQDLVVLVTLGKDPSDFYRFTDREALYD